MSLQRIELPDISDGLQVTRTERQRWERSGFAEGELEIGYGQDGRPVRIAYHWWRYFSRADPSAEDVYTAELWVRVADGDWLYAFPQKFAQIQMIPHDLLRPLLKKNLDIDI